MHKVEMGTQTQNSGGQHQYLRCVKERTLRQKSLREEWWGDWGKKGREHFCVVLVTCVRGGHFISCHIHFSGATLVSFCFKYNLTGTLSKNPVRWTLLNLWITKWRQGEGTWHPQVYVAQKLVSGNLNLYQSVSEKFNRPTWWLRRELLQREPGENLLCHWEVG